jgi:hypothetical protein
MQLTTRTGRILKVDFIHSSPIAADGTVLTRPNVGEVRIHVDAASQQLGRRLSVCEIIELRYPGGYFPNSTQVNYGDNAEYRVLAQGVSICHPKDAFCKATGRKISLTAALALASAATLGDAALSRDDRADVWSEFLNGVGVKNPITVST